MPNMLILFEKHPALLAIISNVLFGVLYIYGKWLAPLGGTSVFLWRMTMMWAGVIAVLCVSKKLIKTIKELSAIQGKNWLYLLLTTPIFASQLWLFMYAPLNGLGVQVSMGYFLFPLVMVVVGFFAGDKLSRLQKLAVVLAVGGVVLEFFRLGEIGVATLWVCLTFPIYYVIRRRLGVSAWAGLLWDTTLIAPVCIAWLIFFDKEALWIGLSTGVMFAKVMGLGIISVLALQTNLEASRRLSHSIFGLLSYLEPALLFLAAITVLGGKFEFAMLGSFGLIWLAIGCLMIQGIYTQKRTQPSSQNALP